MYILKHLFIIGETTRLLKPTETCRKSARKLYEQKDHWVGLIGFNMEKTILVGHDSIEFGWNIMTWIPRVRYKAQEYQETVVITKPGSEYLYADITDKFEYFGGNLKCDRWLYHGKMVVIPKHIKKKYRDADKLIPSWKNCMTSRREYVRYGEFDDDLTYGLVIHARASTKYRSKDRNWSVAKYREVWKALGKPRACSIGTEAFHIPGTADKRNIPIKELCDIMRSSKVMIGPSIGP